ncbi:MAG TPA: UdgX family uracil-DNA binding protein [Gemmatimonadaceae bacterium]|jgi:uracil-DNA glycosylase family protein|nr:UdgX family uracil-DNA binding protein [Gemmatimonadaceae bacterium]
MTKPRRTAKPTGSAADFIPPHASLSKLRAAAKACEGCDLFKLGTQTVFGEGPATAHVMVVGEQPGDAEDRAGRPFVGPSGRLLDHAFDAAGIDRDDVYVTNAVKHFKWAKDARTKRRIHKTPNAGEVRACHPWLEHEIALVKPRVIVCLGATAAKALLGRTFSVMKHRGIQLESTWAPAVFATVHPSAVLRAPRQERALAEKLFVSDMRAVGRYLRKEQARLARRAHGTRKLTAWQTTAHPSDTSSASIRSSPR